MPAIGLLSVSGDHDRHLPSTGTQSGEPSWFFGFVFQPNSKFVCFIVFGSICLCGLVMLMTTSTSTQ